MVAVFPAIIDFDSWTWLVSIPYRVFTYTVIDPFAQEFDPHTSRLLRTLFWQIFPLVYYRLHTISPYCAQYVLGSVSLLGSIIKQNAQCFRTSRVLWPARKDSRRVSTQFNTAKQHRVLTSQLDRSKCTQLSQSLLSLCNLLFPLHAKYSWR